MSDSKKAAARSGRDKAEKAEPQTEQAAVAVERLPEPSTLTQDTFAESFDPSTGEQDADSVATGVVRTTLVQLEEIQKGMRESGQLNDRSKEALAKALAAIYATGTALYENPAHLFACLNQAGVRTTRATRKSAYLPILKLALGDLEPKTQSFYARVLNHCAALQLDRQSAEATILAHGTVELAKREAKRQKARRGEPAGESDAEAAERFRDERRAVPLESVDLGTSEFALLIVGRDGDTVVAFDLDDNEKRLNAAVRAALKRGSQILGGQNDAEDDAAGAEAMADAAE